MSSGASGPRSSIWALHSLGNWRLDPVGDRERKQFRGLPGEALERSAIDQRGDLRGLLAVDRRNKAADERVWRGVRANRRSLPPR